MSIKDADSSADGAGPSGSKMGQKKEKETKRNKKKQKETKRTKRNKQKQKKRKQTAPYSHTPSPRDWLCDLTVRTIDGVIQSGNHGLAGPHVGRWCSRDPPWSYDAGLRTPTDCARTIDTDVVAAPKKKLTPPNKNINILSRSAGDSPSFPNQRWGNECGRPTNVEISEPHSLQGT